MKRLIPIFAAILIIVAGISIPVYAATWEYRFPITATDNTSTSRTYYPVITTSGGQQVINAGYMDNDALDTNMQIGSTSLKYLIAQNHFAFVIPNLPANGVVTSDLYTGYAPKQTTMDIVTGDGGYVTVYDDVTTEITDNGSIELVEAYIKTSAGSDNLVRRNSTYWLYYDGTANLTYEVLFAQTVPNADMEAATSWTNGSRSDVQKHTGTYSWRSDADDAKDTVYQDMAWFTTDMRGRSVTFTAYMYDAHGGGVRVFIDDGVGTYYGNSVVVANFNTTSTVTATLDAAATRIRVGFQDQNAPPNDGDSFMDDVTASIYLYAETPVTSGYYDIAASVNATSGKLELWLDGTLEDSCSYNGTIADNANNIIIGGDVLPCYDSYSHYVDGTRVIYYSPNDMIDTDIGGSNGILPDRSGNGNTGNITWGSNTGLVISYGEMTTYQSTTGNATASSGGADVPTAFMPASWFAMGENLENVFGYAMVHNVVSSMDFPDVDEGVQTMYFIVAIGIAFMVSLLILGGTRSLLFSYGGFLVVLYMASGMTIVPMWIPFTLTLTGIGIMFLYRQVAY